MITVAQIVYDKGAQIGAAQGRNSRVFRCTDPQLGGDLVVKEIEKSRVQNPNLWVESQTMHAANHDHVVPVRYACETTDLICLAMPYYKNGSLTDKIASGPLPLLKVIEYSQGILSGLTAIHIAGHLHFDLKPSNVLFADNDVPLVSDFGQAMPLDHLGVAQAPLLMYGLVLTPEIIAHKQGTVQTDIYQAGLTLYRAMNGEDMFASQIPSTPAELHAAVTSGTFPNRDSFLPQIPRAMRTVIRKSLQVEPSLRYRSAIEMAKAVGRVSLTWPWSVALLPNEEMEWRASRSGRSPLLVALRQSGTRWKVQIYTQKPGSCRAASKVLWRDGMTRVQAIAHLKGVFATLELA